MVWNLLFQIASQKNNQFLCKTVLSLIMSSWPLKLSIIWEAKGKEKLEKWLLRLTLARLLIGWISLISWMLWGKWDFKQNGLVGCIFVSRQLIIVLLLIGNLLGNFLQGEKLMHQWYLHIQERLPSHYGEHHWYYSSKSYRWLEEHLATQHPTKIQTFLMEITKELSPHKTKLSL